MGITVESLKKAIKENPMQSCVHYQSDLLWNSLDLKSLVRIAHRHEMAVLVMRLTVRICLFMMIFL